jgi:hypothetical protein
LHAASCFVNLGGTGAYYKGIRGIGGREIPGSKKSCCDEQLIIVSGNLI